MVCTCVVEMCVVCTFTCVVCTCVVCTFVVCVCVRRPLTSASITGGLPPPHTYADVPCPVLSFFLLPVVFPPVHLPPLTPFSRVFSHVFSHVAYVSYVSFVSYVSLAGAQRQQESAVIGGHAEVRRELPRVQEAGRQCLQTRTSI